MNINITLSEALERASEGLRRKMLHSVELLQKAEKIALNYDAENGYYLAFSGGEGLSGSFSHDSVGWSEILRSHESYER